MGVREYFARPGGCCYLYESTPRLNARSLDGLYMFIANEHKYASVEEIREAVKAIPREEIADALLANHSTAVLIRSLGL